MALLYVVMLFSCMLGGIWPAVWWTQCCRAWAHGPFTLSLVILGDVFLFGLGYLLALLAWRVVIPRPREGFFRSRVDGRPRREMVVFMLNMLLTRLRYEVPWARIVLHAWTVAPLVGGLYRRLFCPHLHAVTLTDTNVILDPYLMHVHPTVQLATGARFSCHLFDQRGLYVKRIVIEEHALIGPEVMIGPGVQIGHHSLVEGRSAIPPNVRIPPYEQWGGVPACKVRALRRPDEGPETVAAASTATGAP